jgi:hypothetical protein
MKKRVYIIGMFIVATALLIWCVPIAIGRAQAKPLEGSFLIANCLCGHDVFYLIEGGFAYDYCSGHKEKRLIGSIVTYNSHLTVLRAKDGNPDINLAGNMNLQPAFDARSRQWCCVLLTRWIRSPGSVSDGQSFRDSYTIALVDRRLSVVSNTVIMPPLTHCGSCAHPGARVTRRRAIQAGAVGLLGLGMNHLSALRALGASGPGTPPGRANSVIYVFGNNETWDTHQSAFPNLKNHLLPPLDRALSALLDDLHAHGQLDETLVVVGSEFGRTPKISSLSSTALPGRDHWGACQSVLLAGGGIPGGAVVGSSDRLGAYPASDPQTPENLAATIYHALGLPRSVTWHDTTGRPHFLYGGEPIQGLV